MVHLLQIMSGGAFTGYVLLLLTFNLAGQSPIFQNSGEGFDISTAYYSGNRYDIEEMRYVGSRDLIFNNDGTKMFIVGSLDQKVVEYELATPYDITTSTYSGSDEELYITERYPQAITFSDDGRKLFVLISDESIVEYPLSTSFDVSTADRNQVEILSITQMSGAGNFEFTDNGKKLFVSGNNRFGIYELGVPYDISTANYSEGQSNFYYSYAENLSFEFSEDGLKMFISVGGTIREHLLSTAFDPSTASYQGVLEEFDFFTEQNQTIRSLLLSEDGFTMYCVTQSDVFEYKLPSSVEVFENTEDIVFDVDASDGNGTEVDQNLTYSLLGDDATLLKISEAGAITFSKAPNFERPDDSDFDNVYRVTVVADNGSSNSSLELAIVVRDRTDTPRFSGLIEGFDISTGTYSGKVEEYFTGVQETRPKALNFNANGSKLFLLGEATKTIFTYELETPYDVSKAVHFSESRFSVDLEESSPRGFTFGNNGTKLYLVGTGRKVISYDLSSEYDVSSAVHSGVEEQVSVEIDRFDNEFPEDVLFTPDGLRMFVLMTDGDGPFGEDVVLEFGLETPFLISTASYSGPLKDLEVGGILDFPSGMSFNLDGTSMFFMGFRRQSVVEYRLKRPYDISSGSFTGFSEELNVSDVAVVPQDIVFNDMGTKLFFTGSQSNIIEYQLRAAEWTLENSDDSIVNLDAHDGLGGAVDVSVSYELNGVDKSFFSLDEQGVLRFNSLPDFESPQDADGDNVYQLIVMAKNGSDSTVLNMDITVADEPDTPVILEAGEGFNLSLAEHTGLENELFVGLEEPSPQSFVFNLDGSQMFMLGWDTKNVYQYDLAIPYLMSSASCTDKLGLDLSSPNGISFNSDGSKMFILDASGTIVPYDLSSPFGLSTATRLESTEELSVRDDERRPTDFSFNPDGTKLFLIGKSNGSVIEYSLSIPFDLASSDDTHSEFNVESEEGNPTALMFSADGTKMFIVGSYETSVLEYNLATAFDVNTAEFNNSFEGFSVQSEEAEPTDLTFNSLGTKMFIIGYAEDKVVEYELPSMVSLNEQQTTEGFDIDANDGMDGTVDTSVTYSVGGQDASHFQIDGNGLLNFSVSQDYSTPLDENQDNVHELNIIVENPFESISLRTLVEVNSVPEFEDQVFTVNEGSSNETPVGTISAFDQDGDELDFTIESGNEGNAFHVSSEGEITVSNEDVINYEENSQYSLAINVSDKKGGADSGIVYVEINSVPVIQDQSFTVDEKSANGETVGTVLASDADQDQIVFAIVSGNTNGAFELSEGGLISVLNNSGLEYELNPSYHLHIEVTDIDGAKATATIIIEVNNVLSIEDSGIESTLTVYPNPIKEIVTLHPKEMPKGKYEITFQSTSGATYQIGELFLRSDKKIEIDLSGYARGIYIISLRSKEHCIRRKVLLH